jgi:uncharacterized membrane protein
MGTSEDPLIPTQAPLEQIAAGFGEVFTGVRRASGDPIIMSSFLGMLLVLGGFGAFFLAWKGSAATLVVPIQLAYLISGGVTGFALIGAGLGIMYVQMSRHLEAREDYGWSIALDRAIGVLGAFKGKKI